MTVEQDRAELRKLQKEWMQAVEDRDMDRLEQIVAPGFRFTAIHLNPEPVPRVVWMAAAGVGNTLVSFASVSLPVADHGDTAVVHSRYSQVASFHHTSLSNAFRLTDVWSRIDGRWQVVARHSSILS